MKKLMFIAALFTVISFSAIAQEKGKRGPDRITPEKRAELRAEKLAEQLDLTEEQKSRVYDTHLERAKANKEASKNRKEEVMERRSAMKRERAEQQAEVEKILSLEQREKWVEIRNEDRERMNQYRDARGNRDRERIESERSKKHRESGERGNQKK